MTKGDEHASSAWRLRSFLFFFFFSLSIRRRSFENNLVETLVIQRRRIGRFVDRWDRFLPFSNVHPRTDRFLRCCNGEISWRFAGRSMDGTIDCWLREKFPRRTDRILK